MPKTEYSYPTGKVLTEELTRRVNNAVGFLDNKLPFPALYIDPRRAFLLPYIFPNELVELYDTYSPVEKRVTRNIYGTLMNYLRDEAKEKIAAGVAVEKEELYPTLEYVQRFTPLGLKEARGISSNGALFIYHSIYPLVD